MCGSGAAEGVCSNICTTDGDCNSNYCVNGTCSVCATNNDCNTNMTDPSNFYGMCTAGKCETTCS